MALRFERSRNIAEHLAGRSVSEHSTTSDLDRNNLLTRRLELCRGFSRPLGLASRGCAAPEAIPSVVSW